LVGSDAYPRLDCRWKAWRGKMKAVLRVVVLKAAGVALQDVVSHTTKRKEMAANAMNVVQSRSFHVTDVMYYQKGISRQISTLRRPKLPP